MLRTLRKLQPLLPALALLGTVGLGVAAALLAPRRGEEMRQLLASVSRERFPRTLQSADGERLRLPRPPRRVVALSLPVEEVLLDVAGPERLAAVTPFARDPRYSHVAELAARVPETVTAAELERIIRLGPDLVLAASYTEAALVTHLRACRIPACVIPEIRSTAGIRALVEFVGFALGLEAEAAARLEVMESRVEAARRQLERARPAAGEPPPRILYLDLPGGQIAEAWTTGRETVLDDVIRAAGAVNAAAAAGMRRERALSPEAILRWDPDWLLLPGRSPNEVLEALRRQPLLAASRAVREARILVLPEADLTCTSHFWTRAACGLIHELLRAGGKP